jgi:hypothetical protein
LSQKKKEPVLFTAKDWNGKDVVLYKSVFQAHIARLHFDAALFTETVKTNLANPIRVIENRAAGSECAIYNIPIGNDPLLVVSIKKGGWFKDRGIATFYGSDESRCPKGKQIWPKQNNRK